MGRKKNFIKDADLSLNIKFEEEGYKLNERFTVHKTSILSYEQVANSFKFSKALIDSKLYQLDMLPVCCFFDENNEPTTHDDRQTPFGAIVPQSYRWEMLDGEEYLFVDTVLWTGRFNQLNNIGNANQSMEICDIEGKYNANERYYEVNDFNFDVLTILHESVKPAFKNAKIDNEEFSNALEQFKQEFAEALKDIDLTKFKQKEGDVKMETEEQKKDVTETEEEAEMARSDEEEIEEEEDMKKDDDKTGKCSDEENFELSHEDVRELLSKKLDTYDSNGYRNYDIWVQEVYDTHCIYSKWNTTNKYFKAEYTKTENDITIGMTEEVFARYLTQSELDTLETSKQADEQRFNELAIKYAELETESNTLRRFKLDKEEEENKVKCELELSKKTELIDSFSDKLSKEEIDKIVTDINSQTFEEIKVGLSIMFADKALQDKTTDVKFANIDSSNKSVSTKEKLLAELKARKK